MSSSWYMMGNKFFNGDENQEINNYSHDGFSELLLVSPESYPIKIDGVARQAIVQQSTDNDMERKILTHIGLMGRGNVIEHKNKKWLITDMPEDNKWYEKSKLILCNISLKWINSQGKIIEYPCHVKPRYTSPISETKSDNSMYIPSDNVRLAIIQNNADTLTILRDKRFIIDNKAWKVVGTDTVSYQGLIYITLFEDPIDTAVDNLDLRIADYKVATYTLTILNGSTSSIKIGDKLQLKTQVMNNGVVVTDKAITYTSSNTTIATVDVNGLVTGVANGSATITASLTDSPSITATISLNVVATVVNAYAVSITSTSTTPNEIKTDQSKVYNAVITNNGTQITDGSQTVVWSLYSDDKATATTLATITSQTGSSCTVKNNNANSGYVQLKATLASDGTVIGWLRIQMKSLI